jgi:hypothetical protein
MEREQLEEKKRIMQKLLQHTAASNRRSEEELHRLVVEDRINTVSKILQSCSGNPKLALPPSELRDMDNLTVDDYHSEIAMNLSFDEESSCCCCCKPRALISPTVVAIPNEHDHWFSKMWSSLNLIRSQYEKCDCSTPALDGVETGSVEVPCSAEQGNDLDVIFEGPEDDDDDDTDDEPSTYTNIKSSLELAVSSDLSENQASSAASATFSSRDYSSPNAAVGLCCGSECTCDVKDDIRETPSESSLIDGIREQIIRNLEKWAAHLNDKYVTRFCLS